MMFDQTQSGNIFPARTPIHNFMLSCGITGSVLFSLVQFSFGMISPDFNMMRQSMTDLELLPNGWIQSANFIVFGLFTCVFAIGLRKELVKGYNAMWITLLQITIGMALIFIGMFNYSPLHIICSMVIYVSLALNYLVFARRFRHDARWKSWSTYSLICFGLTILFIALSGYSKSINHEYAGIFERFVVVTRLLWSLFFAIRLFSGVRLTPISAELKSALI